MLYNISSLEEITLPDEFKKVDDEDFLLFKTEGKKVMMAFCTPQFLDIICKCDTVYMDGFKVLIVK